MYKILGADHREYGPITKEQLIAWIAEGRANGATPVLAEGSTEWKPLSEYPEFQDTLRPKAPPVSEPQIRGFYPEQVQDGDYRLDVGEVISRAIELVRRDFSILLAMTAIWLGIELGIALFSCIPVIGLLFSLGNIIIQGPMLAGIYLVILKRIRGQQADVGGMFGGFNDRFGQYVLAHIVPGILGLVACLPGFVLIGIGSVMVYKSAAVGVLLIIPGAIFSLVAWLYLWICWGLTLPLVADKRIEFWPAMQHCRAMVMKHFLSVAGLFILVVLINLVGLILCFVGLFFTVPVTMAAMMYAYETIFCGSRPAPAVPPPSMPS